MTLRARAGAVVLATVLAALSACSLDPQDDDVKDLRKRTVQQIVDEATAQATQAVGAERATALGLHLDTRENTSTQKTEPVLKTDYCKASSGSDTNNRTSRTEVGFALRKLTRAEYDDLLAGLGDNLAKAGYTVYHDLYDWKWMPNGRQDAPYELAARHGTEEKDDRRIFAQAQQFTSGPDQGRIQVEVIAAPACYREKL
ncbi:hypothetical protein [Yinghuangia seranimata]|uniref:hypothetical protein n=1 Tax=Yinghuangia seranimata TaxID=408067 RepID=UPI00248AC5A3|nr:hypothetical protein [Yinghuangia seranimata]MDI2129337.1 hypothetical protein [Yinghuangia seranimata]